MVDLYYSSDLNPKELVWWPLCEDVVQLHEGLPEWGGVSQPSLLLNRDGLAVFEPSFTHPFRIASEEVKRHASANSMLCRACGVAKTDFLVLDAFGGFGIDALALAHFSSVEVIERAPLTFVVLVELASRFNLPLTTSYGDGMDRIGSASAEFDVVYLDPMFPVRSKRALPNRAMQYLQLRDQEQENDLDLSALIAQAREAASDRVVLKRRTKDPKIGSPNHSVSGKTVRFDVYR